MKKIVMPYSGGMDSFIAAHILKQQGYDVFGVAIYYGQNNVKELEYAKRSAEYLGIKLLEADLSVFFRESSSYMITGIDVESKKRDPIEGSFVYNRNLIFLTYCCNIALAKGIDELAFAISDEVGSYSDATKRFTEIAEGTFLESTNQYIKISLPILGMDKEYLYHYAKEQGLMGAVAELTYTCYANKEEQYTWGVGCMECLSCKTRHRRYLEYQWRNTRNIYLMIVTKSKLLAWNRA